MQDLISDNDKMFIGDKLHYFYVGFDALRICMKYQRLNNRTRLLLIPSGHGRNLRHFLDFVNSRNVYVADIDEDAVNFCLDYFDVNSFLSDSEFAFLNDVPKVDLIFVGSLVTHLLESRTVFLIDLLIKKLKSNGKLILSSHGSFVFTRISLNPSTYGLTESEGDKVSRDFQIDGYGFGLYQGQHDYGISVVSKDYFLKLISKRNDAIVTNYEEAVWDHHHDIIVIKRLGLIKKIFRKLKKTLNLSIKK